MKKGWEYKKLGDVCEIYNGNSINADFKKNNYEGLKEGFPFIATKDISFNGIVDYVNGVRIPFDTTLKVAQASSVFLCAEGGSAGKKIAFIDRQVCFGNKLFCIHPKKNEVYGRFIYYYLKSSCFQGQFKESLTGLIGGVSSKKIKDFIIEYPSLLKQQEIVEYLDSSFAKIDALKANAAKNIEEAKSLFQSALKEALEPKEGWEEKKLDELCSIESKLVNPTLSEYENMIHVGGANIISRSGEFIALKTAKEEGLTSNKFFFDENVVLYNKIRPYLMKVGRPDFSGLCSADMYPLTPTKIIDKGFLFYVLISDDFTDYAIQGSARARMPKVNRNHLFAYKGTIPLSLSEQQSIVSHLDSLSEKVNTLQQNYSCICDECDALKQAILRQVFE